MYFFNLPGFHPVSGINTDNHAKYPYLHFKGTIFKKESTNLIDSYFPFKNIAFPDGKSVFISEKNLIALFKYDPLFKDDLLIDHNHTITKEQLSMVKEDFYKGYFDGIADFPRQIQSTINLPDSPAKEIKLKNFIEFCNDHLFFEGFAIPDCLYALGFIQAYLLKAFGEYQNLIQNIEESAPAVKLEEDLVEKETSVIPMPKEGLTKREANETHTQEQEIVPTVSAILVEEPAQKNKFERIPLDYPAEEIISLWMILLEVWKCKAVNSNQVFFDQQEILNLLGSIFDDSAKKGMLPQSDHKFYDLPPGKHERILNLLMHVTYKLNTDRNNIGLEKYCEALIATFSCYSKTKVASLKSNINKERGNIIQSIKSLPEDGYKNDFLKVLGKINEYVV
jgi:hypothetical protein